MRCDGRWRQPTSGVTVTAHGAETSQKMVPPNEIWPSGTHSHTLTTKNFDRTSDPPPTATINPPHSPTTPPPLSPIRALLYCIAFIQMYLPLPQVHISYLLSLGLAEPRAHPSMHISFSLGWAISRTPDELWIFGWLRASLSLLIPTSALALPST